MCFSFTGWVVGRSYYIPMIINDFSFILLFTSDFFLLLHSVGIKPHIIFKVSFGTVYILFSFFFTFSEGFIVVVLFWYTNPIEERIIKK